MSENCLKALASKPAQLDEVAPAFEDALRFYQVELPVNGQAAIFSIIRYRLRQIADTKVLPWAGLKQLMADIQWCEDFENQNEERYVGERYGLHPLVGLYWSMDDFLGEGTDAWHPGRTREQALLDFDQ
ncbi:MAG: hypothetical protein ACRCV9_03345, partial [Burkholderiaceae bacterium]